MTHKEEFEAWFSDGGEYPKAVEKAANGTYKLAGASSAWTAWKACAGLQDKKIAEAARAVGPDLLSLANKWADNKIHTYQFASEAEAIVKASISKAKV